MSTPTPSRIAVVLTRVSFLKVAVRRAKTVDGAPAMSEKDNYCEKHEVDIDSLPKDYDFCPYCREEKRIEGRRVHEMTRDPMIEPY